MGTKTNGHQANGHQNKRVPEQMGTRTNGFSPHCKPKTVYTPLYRFHDVFYVCIVEQCCASNVRVADDIKLIFKEFLRQYSFQNIRNYFFKCETNLGPKIIEKNIENLIDCQRFTELVIC